MQVDEPSCLKPKRRLFNLTSVSSIKELKTPSFEKLLKAFWDAKSHKLADGDFNHTGSYEATQSVRGEMIDGYFAGTF
jgi:kinesin family protein 11